MPQGNDTDSGWQAQTDVADDTVRVPIVCKERDRETWDEEADEQGYRNRSRYLYDLIQEARALRQSDGPRPRQADQRIQELQSEIERLQRRLEEERKSSSGRVEFDDPAFVERFLTENYQPLSEILQDVVESGALNDLVRQPIEQQLYRMAADDRVEYERGWGWKIVADDNGGGR